MVLKTIKILKVHKMGKINKFGTGIEARFQCQSHP